MFLRILGLSLLLSQNAFGYSFDEVKAREIALQNIVNEMRETYGVTVDIEHCQKKAILRSCLKLAAHLLRGHEEMEKQGEFVTIKNYILMHTSGDDPLSEARDRVKLYHKESRIRVSVSKFKSTAVFKMPFINDKHGDFNLIYVNAQKEHNLTPFYKIVSLAQFQDEEGPGFFSKWPLY